MKPKPAPVPQSIPMSRSAELAAHPDAARLAIKRPASLFQDAHVKRYPSRAALETFLKNPGQWGAVVKTPTPRNMILYPAFQTPTI